MISRLILLVVAVGCASNPCPPGAPAEMGSVLSNEQYSTRITCSSDGYRVQLRRQTGETVSELRVPARRGNLLLGPECESGDGDVVVLAQPVENQEPQILRAWKINFESGRFEEIATTRVRCVTEQF